MKIALRREDGIAILDVSGGVDLQSFQVLKAGLSKLLRDGHNRIALNFPEGSGLPSDVIRELAILDVFARELAGQIVLVSINKEVRDSVVLFSKPPVIPIVDTLADAQEFFRRLGAPAEDAEEEAAALRQALDARDKEIKALEARIKLLDPKVVTQLRAQNAELQLKTKELEAQVERLSLDKRKPTDTAGLMEKIEALEASLEQLSKGQA